MPNPDWEREYRNLAKFATDYEEQAATSKELLRAIYLEAQKGGFGSWWVPADVQEAIYSMFGERRRQ